MKLILLLAFGFLFSGCAKPADGIVLCTTTVPQQHPGQSTPNLALGPSADHLWAATQLTYRSSWPSVSAGYWLDDVSYLTEVQYDQQMHNDRFGWYYRTAESVHTTVRTR
jgi:hypothetical protein